MKRMIWATILAVMQWHLAALTYAAENATPPGRPTARPAGTLQLEREASNGLFDLSFSGGTPQKLIGEMEKASGLKVNVLIPPELADAKIPAMELRSVNVQGVFESLNLLWRNSMQWIRPTRPGWVPGAPGSEPGNVWVLSRPADSRKTQAFYVGHLLKKFKIDDITTAVQTTWQLGGKDTKAELKYHQDTQLLIALGHPEQLSTAAEVLAQLKLAIEPVRIEPEKTDDAKTADGKKGKPAAQP